MAANWPSHPRPSKNFKRWKITLGHEGSNQRKFKAPEPHGCLGLLKRGLGILARLRKMVGLNNERGGGGDNHHRTHPLKKLGGLWENLTDEKSEKLRVIVIR